MTMIMARMQILFFIFSFFPAKSLLKLPWRLAFSHVSFPTRGFNTHCTLAMFVLSLLMMAIQIDASTTCSSNCSNVSPLPYPFGAKPGCGSPGFQITDCSGPTPLWNLTLAETPHPYYISSIGPNPNHSNPHQGSIPNYGYGGTVVLLINNSAAYFSPLCEFKPVKVDNFTTSNFYAFEDADLTFYQDHYLLFNCTSTSGSRPHSGVLTPSSGACTKYIDYCNFGTSTNCFDYVPDKELQLSTLTTTLGCSSVRRYIIKDVDAPVPTWVSAAQLAWGPVRHADSCSSCQSSGGDCGYDVQENNRFQCYCEDGAHDVSCHEASGKQIGIGIGVSIAIVFILVCGGVACYRRHKYLYYTLFSKEHLKLDSINQAPLDFPYGALAVATKSFSTNIGQGAFGKVYLGVLLNGSEVAVKVLDASMSHTDEQFMNEIATIGNIHHMNVARLVGFCFQRSKRILVYEYVSNGSLDKYLFPSKQSFSGVVLSWKQRYDIALGIARGLYYMHEECRNCIIHCDIKPQNILLDVAFCPKISDFGLAKLLTKEESRILTQARGTPGYVAPEFWSLGSGRLTSKFDVYSYGVVLLEIIRGRRCFSMLDEVLEEESEEDSWMSVSVDRLVEGEADLEQVKVCTLVALWCIQEDPALRPTMSKVVQYLQGTAIPENPPKPFSRLFNVSSQMPLHFSDSSYFSSNAGGAPSLSLQID
ncbi:hypothetical protein L7F22_031001 [Adiantum nelumboides]|nr:hypothetical protein [Adiantum nelumboides]